MARKVASPRLNQRIAQIFKHNKYQGLLVWTFWVTYDDLKFFATKWTAMSEMPEPKKYEHKLGYSEMVEGYNKLIAGGGDMGDAYTEIEPLMSREDIWELIKKCKAQAEEEKKFKFKGN